MNYMTLQDIFEKNDWQTVADLIHKELLSKDYIDNSQWHALGSIDKHEESSYDYGDDESETVARVKIVVELQGGKLPVGNYTFVVKATYGTPDIKFAVYRDRDLVFKPFPWNRPRQDVYFVEEAPIKDIVADMIAHLGAALIRENINIKGNKMTLNEKRAYNAGYRAGIKEVNAHKNIKILKETKSNKIADDLLDLTLDADTLPIDADTKKDLMHNLNLAADKTKEWTADSLVDAINTLETISEAPSDNEEVKSFYDRLHGEQNALRAIYAMFF